jgi:viroplasmin and RNaseH domain-containing protein
VTTKKTATKSRLKSGPKIKGSLPVNRNGRSLRGSQKVRGRTSEYNNGQVEMILDYIAEGLTIKEINERAAKLDDPFQATSQIIYYYRRSREVDLNKIREEKEFDALRTGLSIKTNRLKALYKLANKLESDIEKGKLWLARTKSILVQRNMYEKISEIEFIGNLVKELRGVYADIAAETGGRIMKADITSKGKEFKGYVTISPDDWDIISKEKESK